MLICTSVEAEFMIAGALRLLEPDLDIVTSERAIIRTNRFLIGQSSPFLKSLLTTDMSSHAILHIPDIPTRVIFHLINIITKGFTSGPGLGDSVVKEIKVAAKMLGFERIPVLTSVVGRLSQPDLSHQEVEDYLQRPPTVESNESGNGIVDNDADVLVTGEQINRNQYHEDTMNIGTNEDKVMNPTTFIKKNVLDEMLITTEPCPLSPINFSEYYDDPWNSNETDNVPISNINTQRKSEIRKNPVRRQEIPIQFTAETDLIIDKTKASQLSSMVASINNTECQVRVKNHWRQEGTKAITIHCGKCRKRKCTLCYFSGSKIKLRRSIVAHEAS